MNADTTIGSGDRLSFTFFLAFALHAVVIFGVSFSVDRGEKVAPNLNITLATHNSSLAPEKADFLAQHNQQASGTEAEAKELTVRDVADIQDVQVRDISPIPQQKASQKQNIETRIITTEQQSSHSVVLEQSQDSENEIQQDREGEEADMPLVLPELASLQAKLDRQKQAFAKMPRIRRLHSASTRASHEAAYLHTVGQKIERVGAQNFPEVALQKNILGKLVLRINILPSGAVANVEIVKTSGYDVLDEAALQIVKSSSPFPPIPREILKNWDRLEVYRAMLFEIDGVVSTF